MKEIWKDIKDYEGLYQISNYGNVKSLERKIIKSNGTVQIRKERIMTKRENSDGYYIAKLNVNNHSKSVAIHRLVAQHFIDNPYNFPEVNHIDCNRKNNNAENLEWITHIDNVSHSKNKGHYKHYGSDNPNYNKHTLHNYYAENPEAKNKLKRIGNQNGMSKSVKLFDEDMNFVKEFSFIGECAQYLIDIGVTSAKINSIRNNITLAKNIGKKYLNYYYL